MNRFRVNLHPAFFEDIEAISTALEQKEFFTELETLAQTIWNEEFKGASSKFLEDVNQNKERRITSKYDLSSQDPGVREKEEKRFKADYENFSKRLNANQNDWDSKIIQGFGRLIHALQDEWYFDEIKNIKDNEEKNKKMRKKIDKVKGKYWNEVRKLYINNVWPNSKDRDDDNKFNYVKDKLFDVSHLDYYPANKIYCKLMPWATSILGSRSTYTEWYGIWRVESDGTYFTAVEAENLNWDEKYLSRSQINFLSNDLPEYLRDIKGKTIWNISLMFYGENEYRASKNDRKAIKQFLKVASKIGTTNGEESRDRAIALLEVFNDNELLGWNSHKETYRKLLQKHWLSAKKDSDLLDIVKAGNFYKSTQQSEATKTQHAIYLDILAVIKDANWPRKVYKNLQKEVETTLAQRKKDRKEWITGETKLNQSLSDVADYENFKNVSKLANILWITDLESVARLVDKSKAFQQALVDLDGKNEEERTDEQKKAIEYFQNYPIERILANLNNDDMITGRDFTAWWQKSWHQFLEILNNLSRGNENKKQELLNNLYKRAILEMKALKLDTNEDGSENFKDPEEIEQQIKAGNVNVILFLQNIISKPGEDLVTLLSGHEEDKSILDGMSPDKRQEVEKEMNDREQAYKRAEKIINEKYRSFEELKVKCKEQWIDVVNAANLQADLAACLYDTYKLWLWAWSTLTFHDWAEWLTIWYGAQVRNKWKAVLGLSIWFQKDFYVGKGWTISPSISGWLLVPVFSWKPKSLAHLWIDLTAEQETLETTTWKVTRQWFDWGIDILTGVVYAWYHRNRDQLEGVESAAKIVRDRFEVQVMRPLLENIMGNISPLDDQKRKIDVEDQSDMIAREIRSFIENNKDKIDLQDLKKEDIDGMIFGMIRMLSVYNNADLNDEVQRYLIAKNVADQYLTACVEQKKMAVEQEGRYYSWYSIWLFWKIWTPLVWVYGTKGWSEHERDGTVNVSWNSHEQEEDSNIDDWSNDTLNNIINSQLNLKRDEALSIVKEEGNEYNGLVKIPASILNRVKVTAWMKGLMKRDETGNVYVHAKTPMRAITEASVNTRWGEIIIGWNSDKYYDLRGNEWYTGKAIAENDVMRLRQRIDVCTTRTIDEILKQIKNVDPTAFKGHEIENISSDYKLDIANKVNEILKKWHNAVLAFEWRNDNKPKIKVKEWTDTEKHIDVECASNAEIIKDEAKAIADAVYEQVLKIDDSKALSALYGVKHKTKKWQERIPSENWTKFQNAYDALISDSGNPDKQQEVRVALRNIFEGMGDTGKVFTGILNEKDFDNLEGDTLVQTLMSINNIFARSQRVVWKENHYEFRNWNGKRWVNGTMSDIIRDRGNSSTGILKTLKDNPNIRKDSEVVGRYEKLFKRAQWIVDNDSEDQFGERANVLNSLNTVGFNLWDRTNPENPLLNAQVYDTPSVNELDWLDSDAKNGLHMRAMEKFANNAAMINPILNSLRFDESKKGAFKKALQGAVEFGKKNKGDNPQNAEGENRLYIDNEWKCNLELDIDGKKLIIKADMRFWFYTQCVNHTIMLANIEWSYDGNTVAYESWAAGPSVTKESTGWQGMSTRHRRVGFSVALSEERWDGSHSQPGDGSGNSKPGDSENKPNWNNDNPNVF